MESFYKALVPKDRPFNAGRWKLECVEEQSVMNAIGEDGTIFDLWEERGDDTVGNLMQFVFVKWQ